jgi:hypothetical protein
VLGAIAPLLHTSSRSCSNYSRRIHIFAFFVEINTTEGTLIYRVCIHVYKGRQIRAKHSSTVLLTPPQHHLPNPEFDSPLRRTKAFTDKVPYLKIRILEPSTIYETLSLLLLFTLYTHSLRVATSRLLFWRLTRQAFHHPTIYVFLES